MKEYGILQPIVVRPHAGGKYEIIAGERRWRAAQQAGITEIPVIIRHVSGKQAQEINLIENIQREDLNPIETAEALKRLIEEYGYTQQDIAEKICKNRSSVANTLRLLDLPLPVREMVRTGKITEGHGRALLGLKENSAIVKMANLIAEKNLSVREVEKRVSALNKKNTGEIETKKKFKILPEIKELCQRLQRKLGTKVELKHTNKGNGKMEIYYRSLDELERILALIFKK
jgi:ParB family chromosome partitioning protein